MKGCCRPGCDEPRALGGPYCREHRNAYMRQWHRDHPDARRRRDYSLTCCRPNCGAPSVCGTGYCAVHRAEYMREWRKSHPMTREQLDRRNARLRRAKESENFIAAS